MSKKSYRISQEVKSIVFNQGQPLTNIQNYFPKANTDHSQYAEGCICKVLEQERILFCPDLYQDTTVVDRIADYAIPNATIIGDKDDTQNGHHSCDGWFWYINRWRPYDVKSFDLTVQGIEDIVCSALNLSHSNAFIFIYDKKKYSGTNISASLPEFITTLSEISTLPKTPKNIKGKRQNMHDYFINGVAQINGLYVANSGNRYDACIKSAQYAQGPLSFRKVLNQFIMNCKWP